MGSQMGNFISGQIQKRIIMQFQLYACENIKILLPLPRFTLLPFHLHEYLLHGILDTQISLLCLYRQFIINNSEFMTRYNFNFYHSTRSGSKLFQKFYSCYSWMNSIQGKCIFIYKYVIEIVIFYYSLLSFGSDKILSFFKCLLQVSGIWKSIKYCVPWGTKNPAIGTGSDIRFHVSFFFFLNIYLT